MTHTVATASNVIRSSQKLYFGVPGETRRPLTGLNNVGQAMKFLLARKLGWKTTATLALGHAGRLHSWPLVERSDLSVLEEIFLDREYALDVLPPKVVFDLGANFGAASVYFAQQWPEAQIFSVEPNPVIFRRLVAMTAGYPAITCINCAVGERDGTADFVVSADHLGSSLFRRDPNGHTIRVEMRTLASLMAETGVSRIDVLKFDVEGAEEGLFRDASALAKVDALVGEVHKDLMKMSVAEYLALFADYVIEKRSESADLVVMTAFKRSA